MTDTVGERMLPLYEAKMLHHYDHRWATYEGAGARDVTLEEKRDPNFSVLPRYWVPATEVTKALRGRWDRSWFLGWRDIARSTDERTTIAGSFPFAGVGNKIPLMFVGAISSAACLQANLTSLALDFASRQKVGGASMNYFIYLQLPVLSPTTYEDPSVWDRSLRLDLWIINRVKELVFTAEDFTGLARDLGDDGAPFVWDDERRTLIRSDSTPPFSTFTASNAMTSTTSSTRSPSCGARTRLAMAATAPSN
jgi:hypothetical protein